LRLEVLERGPNYARFVVHGVPQAVANFVRRSVTREVPTMAVEEGLLIENSSSMADEMLLHRISLIPFISDIDHYVAPEDCSCGSSLGCERCVVRYTLKKEAGPDLVTVYSGDLVPEDPSTEVKPASAKIPIIKLAQGQRLSLELYVRVGSGKKHAKWQSGIATVIHVPNIEINQGTCTVCGKCVEACARDVLAVGDGKVVVSKLYQCTLCGDCVKACPVQPSAIKVSPTKDSFVFYIESFGFLTPKRMFAEAVNILRTKVADFMASFEEAIKEGEAVATPS